jgi:hypothetical protein
MEEYVKVRKSWNKGYTEKTKQEAERRQWLDMFRIVDECGSKTI